MNHLIEYLLNLRSNHTWVCGEFYSRGGAIPGRKAEKPVTESLSPLSQNKYVCIP